MHYIYYTCYSFKITLQEQQLPTYSIHIKPFSYSVGNIFIYPELLLASDKQNIFQKFKMHVKYPCCIWKMTVAKNNYAICCDKCNQWVHITCNKITKYCFKKLQKDKSPWYCRQCVGKVIPFSNMTDMQLNRLMKERYLMSQKLITLMIWLLLYQIVENGQE